jgi:hypothetical protein
MYVRRRRDWDSIVHMYQYNHAFTYTLTHTNIYTHTHTDLPRSKMGPMRMYKVRWPQRSMMMPMSGVRSPAMMKGTDCKDPARRRALLASSQYSSLCVLCVCVCVCVCDHV